jgi:hypothetical protein
MAVSGSSYDVPQAEITKAIISPAIFNIFIMRNEIK